MKCVMETCEETSRLIHLNAVFCSVLVDRKLRSTTNPEI
jgi:hypothetical protein